jgi:cell division protein FtsL
MEGMTRGQKVFMVSYFVGFWVFAIYALLTIDTQQNRIGEYENIIVQQQEVLQEYQLQYGELSTVTE